MFQTSSSNFILLSLLLHVPSFDFCQQGIRNGAKHKRSLWRNWTKRPTGKMVDINKNLHNFRNCSRVMRKWLNYAKKWKLVWRCNQSRNWTKRRRLLSFRSNRLNNWHLSHTLPPTTSPKFFSEPNNTNVSWSWQRSSLWSFTANVTSNWPWNWSVRMGRFWKMVFL